MKLPKEKHDQSEENKRVEVVIVALALKIIGIGTAKQHTLCLSA